MLGIKQVPLFPPEEQPVLLTAEPSLQLQTTATFKMLPTCHLKNSNHAVLCDSKLTFSPALSVIMKY